MFAKSSILVFGGSEYTCDLHIKLAINPESRVKQKVKKWDGDIKTIDYTFTVVFRIEHETVH